MPDVTELLIRWRAGDAGALDQLMPLVYAELREVASRMMRHERRQHTVQSTALVHEAYMKLVDYDRIDWKGRAHFVGIAATIIRNLLVDQARSRHREKRGGDICFLQLDEAIGPLEPRNLNIIQLNDALQTLEKLSPRQARIVELRFFGGLTVEETAETLEISEATVKRDWIFARTWLTRELSTASS